MSLDGYVVGPRDSVDAPMGVGGFRLFNWLDRRDDPGPNGQVFAETSATRAVISGRRTYEHAGRWQGDHHDGVPIFVLTHDVPDDPPPGSVRYVTDVRECAGRPARRPATATSMVHGAGAAQALLRAGQLDELELHVVPVLLGQGRRLFDHLPAEQVELELIRRLTTAADDEPAQRSRTCATASDDPDRAVRQAAAVAGHGSTGAVSSTGLRIDRNPSGAVTGQKWPCRARTRRAAPACPLDERGQRVALAVLHAALVDREVEVVHQVVDLVEVVLEPDRE